MEYKKIRFPDDEQAHDCAVEWWYFNGNLEDENGRRYAFMDCLFKLDVNRLKIPLLKCPFKTSYFAHSILSDISCKRLYSEVCPLSVVSSDSFSKSRLFISYKNFSLKKGPDCVIESPDERKYRIRTKNLDLEMKSLKKPLLEGGKGFLDLKPEKTYYYSLTNLQTRGRIKIKNKWIGVKGKSWMDHQWSDARYNSNIKWSWFSIQLQNETEIVCTEYGNGKSKTRLACMSCPDGSQKHFSEVEFKPLGERWKSEESGVEYPLAWEIRIPKAETVLKVETSVEDNEVNFGTFNYFEGSSEVRGKMGEDHVSGHGFIELAGYPPKTVIVMIMVLNWMKKLGIFQ